MDGCLNTNTKKRLCKTVKELFLGDKEQTMQNPQMLQYILGRYDMQLVYRFDEMKQMEINNNFIPVLLKMFDEECFPKEELERFDLRVILDYIKRTHQYYLNKRLPEMEQCINLLLQDYTGDHPLLLILRNFYHDYRANLTRHINAEEKQVLPHIELLLDAATKGYTLHAYNKLSDGYSLKNFFDDHTDTEKDLEEVRRVITQYNPPATNQTPYRILLTQMQLFEKDLSIHAMIEDEILIPKAIALEDSLYRSWNN
jgi:regulator of cell morphogenesis and NO signaling